jgi:DNA-binding transcriptional LysR family regulator
MRLRHIEVFHAIMQVGTISGAAKLLYVTQPAVTKVLRHCEMQLGMPLFVRVKGRLHPTPEARRLFTEVDRLHRDLQAVRRLAGSLKDRMAETVRLMSTPTLAASVVPAALTAWRTRYPAVQCRLATQHTREIVGALLLGECDFALSLQDPVHPSIHAEPLAAGPMTALAPAGTWAAARNGQDLPVRQLPPSVIGLPEDDPLGSRVVDTCLDAEHAIESHTVVQTYQIARSLVESGGGVAVIDPFTAASADPAKVQRRPLAPRIEVELHLLTPHHAPLSQSARALVQCIREAAAACLEASGLQRRPPGTRKETAADAL